MTQQQSQGWAEGWDVEWEGGEDTKRALPLGKHS